MELAGKTVLLTGATGGLGRAIAEAMAARGAKLVLSSRKEEELRELAGSLNGEDHRYLAADLAELGSDAQLLADAGTVDVLVANAALPGTGRVEEYSPGDVSRALRVNLEVPIQMSRALIPGMRERGAGHIALISSLNGKVATPRSSIYAATKFGLRGFGLALREDLWGSGVGASLILPGFVREAGMFHESGAKAPPGLGTTTPAQVGNAVVRAVEKNRAEIEVAPFVQRRLANFAHRRPNLAAAISRRNAGPIADKLAEGQADKR